MSKNISYIPHGVCSSKIDIAIEEGCILEVKFTGGCHGNGLGLAALLRGMQVDAAISRLEGIKCGSSSTSCPDQLALALKKIKGELP